jgi:tetratricopeptide (TPR) repeat protein
MRDRIAALTDLGELAAAMQACTEMVSLFADADDPSLRYSVAVTELHIASLQARSGRFDIAMASYDRLVEEFGREGQQDIHDLVATVRYDHAVALEKMGLGPQAIEAYEGIIQDFARAPVAQETVAKAMVNEGVQWLETGDADRASSKYECAIDAFKGSSSPEIRAQMAKALFNLGNARERAGRPEDAIASYDRAFDAYSGDTLAAQDVTSALTNKAVLLLRLGRRPAALAVCAQIRKRLAEAADSHSLLCLRTVESIEQAPADYPA